MSTPPTPVPTAELQKHLAYEVDWLVFAARRFRETGGKDAVLVQDSAFVHARNLLEFTKPPDPDPRKKDKGPSNGWWISREFHGDEPTDTDPSEFKPWWKFINANVTHLSKNRSRDVPCPAPWDKERLVVMARFALDRIETFAPDASGEYGEVIRRIVRDGKLYLATGNIAPLRRLDKLTE